MEVARDLAAGINGETVDVRFLGLYDPVDMAPGYGDAETISANVQTAAVIYASGTSEEIGIAGKRNAEDTDWMERRSRGYTFDDDGDIFPDNIKLQSCGSWS